MQAAAPLRSSQHSISSLSLQSHVPKPNRLLLLLLSSHSYPNITNAGCGCRRLSTILRPEISGMWFGGEEFAFRLVKFCRRSQIHNDATQEQRPFRTRSSARSSMIFASKGKNNKPDFTSQTSETSLLTISLLLSTNQRLAFYLLGPTAFLLLTSSHV
jgi:hypothetical protein